MAAVNADGTLATASLSRSRVLPVLGDPLAGWRPVPDRHADHGLQHVQTMAGGKTKKPPVMVPAGHHA